MVKADYQFPGTAPYLPASPEAVNLGCVCPKPMAATSLPRVAEGCPLHGCTCLHSMHGRVRNPGCNIHGTPHPAPTDPKG